MSETQNPTEPEVTTAVAAVPTGGAELNDAPERTEQDDDKDAIEALRSLSPRMFQRLCRRIPLRVFLPELEKLDRGVFYRHFKGYRPQKIDAVHLERVFKMEIFTKGNGLLAQLVIFNWDEAEWRLYKDLQAEVKKINEDVEAIEAITDEQGDAILAELKGSHDLRDLYLGFVINGVRVSKEFLDSRFADVKA